MKANIFNKFDEKNYSPVIELVINNAEKVLAINNKSINIILVSDEEIRELNLQYRKKDYATDVLTFPDGYLNNLGDVFISIPRTISQSFEYNHSFERELGFLVIHGLLHTMGYDHETEEEENIMTDLQNTVLKKSALNR